MTTERLLRFICDRCLATITQPEGNMAPAGWSEINVVSLAKPRDPMYNQRISNGEMQPLIDLRNKMFCPTCTNEVQKFLEPKE